MKLSEKKSGNFTPHEEGTFRAVCVDVTPLEKKQTQYGERETFRLVFETDAQPREDGSRQCVWSRPFTASLNEKSSLRKFLRQWFGRDLNATELTELDTEAALLERPAQLVITHETSPTTGDVFATIVACTPYRGESPLQPSGKFTRKKDRDAAKGAGEEASYRKAASPTGGVVEAEPVDNTQAGSDWTTVKVHVGNNAGVELRDLDAEKIQKLITNWLPKHAGNQKPTADDKRLAAALEMAREAMAEVKEDF